MAKKKHTITHPMVRDVEELVENLLPDRSRRQIDIPPEIAAQAESVISETEVRLAAITQAAISRWDSTVNEYSVDEDGPPVFGDQEFDAFLKTAENLAECAWFMTIAGFFGLPEPVIEEVLVAKMSSSSSTVNGKQAAGVVVKRHRTGQP